MLERKQNDKKFRSVLPSLSSSPTRLRVRRRGVHGNVEQHKKLFGQAEKIGHWHRKKLIIEIHF